MTIIETEERYIFSFRDVFFQLFRVRVSGESPTWRLICEKDDEPATVWGSKPSLVELKRACVVAVARLDLGETR